MGEIQRDDEHQRPTEPPESQEASPPLNYWKQFSDRIRSRLEKLDLTLAHQKAAELIRELESRGLKVHGSSQAGSSAVKVFLKVDSWVELFPNPIIIYPDGAIYMNPHQGSLARAAIDEPVYAAIQALRASQIESKTPEA